MLSRVTLSALSAACVAGFALLRVGDLAAQAPEPGTYRVGFCTAACTPADSSGAIAAGTTVPLDSIASFSAQTRARFAQLRSIGHTNESTLTDNVCFSVTSGQPRVGAEELFFGLQPSGTTRWQHSAEQGISLRVYLSPDAGYFVELVEGLELRRLVKVHGPLAESQGRTIPGQLARAFEHVHARGLVHRDSKPGNVMITRHGEGKLTDVGLAVQAVGLDDQTRNTDLAVMGTPAFMAPEQIAGGLIDRRTYVCAVGGLTYDLLTGRHLFRAKSPFELVQEQLTMVLPPAAETGTGIGVELHEYLQGALRVKPDERPTSLASIVGWAARCVPPTDGPTD